MYYIYGQPLEVPPIVRGTVTVNATGTKLYTGTPGTSINYTGLTVASGSNTAIVGLLFVDSNTNISGVTATWDSGGAAQAMTQILEADDGGGNSKALYIFGLAGEHGPVSTGNKTLNVSWTGSQRTFFVAMAFDDVDQTGGAFSFHTSTKDTSPSTINVSSWVGDKVIALESSGTGQGTSTGTLIFDDHAVGAVINAMCQYDNGAATVAIGNSGVNASIAGCSIFAAPVVSVPSFIAAWALQSNLPIIGTGTY